MTKADVAGRPRRAMVLFTTIAAVGAIGSVVGASEAHAQQTPLIEYKNGPVLTSPKIYLLFWGNFTTAETGPAVTYVKTLADYLSNRASSPGMVPTIRQYGVFDVTVTGSQIDKTGSPSKTDAALQAEIQARQAAGGASVPPYDDQTLIVVVEKTAPGDCGGFHNTAGTNKYYAYVPYTQCFGFDAEGGFESLVSHEIIEGISDPDVSTGWSAPIPNGELADFDGTQFDGCQSDLHVSLADGRSVFVAHYVDNSTRSCQYWASAQTPMQLPLIGQQGHALNYVQCATEGGSCQARNKYVAFGANGKFRFLDPHFSGGASVPCNNATFGNDDPAPGVRKACYVANYFLDVPEGQATNVVGPSNPRNVAFGANGKFNFATKSGFFICDKATFGDPLPGVAKACYVSLPDYQLTAQEGGNLTGLDRTPVAFGANGNFVYQVASGSKACTNIAFGQDPMPNVSKSCYVVPTSLFPFLADEGNNNTIGAGTVLYGSGLNGYFIKANPRGTVSCSFATFGADPHVNWTKHCY
jgi:hypothetical protein